MVKLFDRLAHHPNGHGDGPLVEALSDHRLACIARALDDREIALRQQSQVFFQISGAGHDELLLGLTRSLRAGYDECFPDYRDRALVLALGVTPLEILLQAVGSADDPASGGRQMPCHWGDAARHIVSQSSPTGSQCLPAVGCAEAGRYIVGRDLPGCSAHGDEVTYVSPGEGARSEGEFWESLNTACRLGLPVLYVVADNGYAISVRASDQAPAPVSEMVMGIRGLHVTVLDGRDYFEVRTRGAEAIQRVRAGQGPGLIHATVTRPYSHSLSDDQKKYRVAEELEDEAEHDPILLLERQLVRLGVLTPERAQGVRAEANELVAAAAKDALTAARPDPETISHHLVGPPPVTEVPSDPPVAAGDPGAFGEAIRLTLHQEKAPDPRTRVSGDDVADADTRVLGKGPG